MTFRRWNNTTFSFYINWPSKVTIPSELKVLCCLEHLLSIRVCLSICQDRMKTGMKQKQNKEHARHYLLSFSWFFISCEFFFLLFSLPLVLVFQRFMFQMARFMLHLTKHSTHLSHLPRISKSKYTHNFLYSICGMWDFRSMFDMKIITKSKTCRSSFVSLDLV